MVCIRFFCFPVPCCFVSRNNCTQIRALGGGLKVDVSLDLITQPGSGAHPHVPEIIIYPEIIILTLSTASKLSFAALKSWLQAKNVDSGKQMPLCARSGGSPMSATPTYSNLQPVFMKSLSLVWSDNVSYSGGRKYLETKSDLWEEVELIGNCRKHQKTRLAGEGDWAVLFAGTGGGFILSCVVFVCLPWNYLESSSNLLI